MAGDSSNGEKVRQIVKLLPRVNCGHCGFGNCGGFALALVEGKASPFGCEVHPLAGIEISKVLGIEIPEEWKEPAEYSSQTGISTGIGVERGRALGFGHHGHGHHGGHHSHSLGHGRDGRHHLRRHLIHHHSH
jgi:hypothetical protein